MELLLGKAIPATAALIAQRPSSSGSRPSPSAWPLTAAFRGDPGRTFTAWAVLLGFALITGLAAAIRASHGWGRSAAL